MLIWLNRDQLAAHNITFADVEEEIRTENVEYPAGQVDSEYNEISNNNKSSISSIHYT